MPSSMSFYEILGVPDFTSDLASLKRGFRTAALKQHPDKNPDDQVGATASFQILQNAFVTLTDPVKRSKYDSTLRLKRRRISHARSHRPASPPKPSRKPPSPPKPSRRPASPRRASRRPASPPKASRRLDSPRRVAELLAAGRRCGINPYLVDSLEYAKCVERELKRKWQKMRSRSISPEPAAGPRSACPNCGPSSSSGLSTADLLIMVNEAMMREYEEECARILDRAGSAASRLDDRSDGLEDTEPDEQLLPVLAGWQDAVAAPTLVAQVLEQSNQNSNQECLLPAELRKQDSNQENLPIMTDAVDAACKVLNPLSVASANGSGIPTSQVIEKSNQDGNEEGLPTVEQCNQDKVLPTMVDAVADFLKSFLWCK
eukprot:gnl/MRDRNA2_/MRDRNA2_124288_c0_seq1.p1 gnl/MRDRNA2_/MRDRNA2_124288_c0~~gnl/MRDRNA2_/MRDRNA2_124288_c0_seq1.p1  ORF type:complete len:374 (+),score=58.45 gnl/MRDRNA2_/MRDRNA2_124288_c0_seq1:116-1237(+)